MADVGLRKAREETTSDLLIAGHLVEHLEFKGLRRFMDTYGQELGFSLAQVSMRAGHDPAVAAKHYTGRVQQSDRDLADAIGELVTAAGTGQVGQQVSEFSLRAGRSCVDCPRLSVDISPGQSGARKGVEPLTYALRKTASSSRSVDRSEGSSAGGAKSVQ